MKKRTYQTVKVQTVRVAEGTLAREGWRGRRDLSKMRRSRWALGPPRGLPDAGPTPHGSQSCLSRSFLRPRP
jgi:hypothetical protein